MKFKYLIKDQKGAFSKFTYGKKGEKVMVIGRQSNMILVINLNGDKFFVNEKNLTDAL